MPNDPRIETFYAEARHWRPELQALREILRDMPLEETFKWRGPCYVAHGGNVGVPFGFRDRCAFSFFKGTLLSDRSGRLAPAGPNSRAAKLFLIPSVAALQEDEPALRAFLTAAIALEKEGRKVAFEKDDLEAPAELTAALGADPALAAAFAALTPGRRRAYILNISQAKQSATRTARVAKHSPRILAGKGLQDR